MKVTKVVAIGCFVVAIAGCGSQAATLQTNSATAVSGSFGSSSATAAMEQAVVNPLDRWFKGPVPDFVRRNSEEQQVAACMKRSGLEWVPLTFPPDEPTTREALKAFRRTQGYGMNTSQASAVNSDTDPNLRLMKGLKETDLLHYLDVLEGPYGSEGRSGGCRGQAGLPNAADMATKRRLNNPRAAELWNAMQASVEVTQGIKSWSQCMATSGFAGLNGPEDARARAGESGSSTAELEIANADVRCAEATLWDAWLKFGDPAVKELGPP